MIPVFTFITSHQRKTARSRLNEKRQKMLTVCRVISKNSGVDDSRIFFKASTHTIKKQRKLLLAAVLERWRPARITEADWRHLMAGFNYSRNALRAHKTVWPCTFSLVSPFHSLYRVCYKYVSQIRYMFVLLTTVILGCV